jgi:hypothetical protein
MKSFLKKKLSQNTLGRICLSILKKLYTLLVRLKNYLKYKSYVIPEKKIYNINEKKIYNIKVNVGGGKDYSFENWTNIDNVDNSNPVDINNGLAKIDSRSVDLVYSSHTFEHLSNHNLNISLQNINRILTLHVHGRLIIKIPDFDLLLDKHRENDKTFFDMDTQTSNWGYETVVRPTLKNFSVEDTISARAAYMFCGLFNKEFGNLFENYNVNNHNAYNGPPPLSDDQYKEILRSNSPHNISKELIKKIDGRFKSFTFNHQNAWSKKEFIQHLSLFGFKLLSMDKSYICERYKNEIPDIMGMYDISAYYEFRLTTLNEIFLDWFNYNQNIISLKNQDNSFEEDGFYFDCIEASDAVMLLEKLKCTKKTIITNEDYSPGFFTALMPLNLDDFNNSSSFYKLDKDFLVLIEKIIKKESLKIENCLNSKFTLLNLRAWSTKPGSPNEHMYGFHCDGYPNEIFKIMLYLTPFNKDFGGLEIVHDTKIGEKVIFDETEKIGVYCLFKNSLIKHRGVPGKNKDRVSIEITLIRSKVDHDINLCAFDTNSYYPISPDYLINNSFIEK